MGLTNLLTFFLIFFLCFSSNAYCQKDSIENNILTTKKYRRGIYKTFEEFKSNSPSYTTFGLGTPKELSGRLDYKIVILNNSKEELYTGPLWGFCNGDSIFINLSPEEPKEKKNTTFSYLEVVGKYCCFDVGYGIAWGRNYHSNNNDKFAFDILDGKIFVIKTKFLQGLLNSEKELKEKFSDMEIESYSPFYIISEYNKYFLKGIIGGSVD